MKALLKALLVSVSFSCLVALAAGCDTAWIDPMEEQKKYLPYSENVFFPDGRAMRPLIETTVPRERYIGPSSIRDGLDGDRPVERIPIPITGPLLARGRNRYDIFCAPCHGILGDGNSYVATKMSLRLPPSLVEGRASSLAPGVIYRAIAVGYGLMNSYAVQLPIQDRWAVIAYVEALQESRHAAIGDAPPAAQKRLSEVRP